VASLISAPWLIENLFTALHVPLDLAEVLADADEPSELAPGHVSAVGSFQLFDEFLIALVEVEPVEPAFLD